MDISSISFDIETFMLYFIIYEAIAIFFLVIALFGIKFYQIYNAKKQKRLQQEISLIILESMELENPQHCELLKPYRGMEMLLHQVEAFDRRFLGALWEEVKSEILRQHLLPYARKYYNSFSWIKRNFAARCFSLEPFPIDEAKILKLLNDKIFLVRSAAATAVVKLGIETGIQKIIEYMSERQGYSRIFFEDLLINQGSFYVFAVLEDIASENKDPDVQIACLDVLSGKTLAINRPFLHEDLDSEHDGVRLAAVRLYANNLQKNSEEVLSRLIKDTNSDIRAEAVEGLSHFLSEHTLEVLENSLSDPAWIVRLKAAFSLKKMGKLGMEILKKQMPELNKRAYDTAIYALQFDW
jgi:HEAT repeat protein